MPKQNNMESQPNKKIKSSDKPAQLHTQKIQTVSNKTYILLQHAYKSIHIRKDMESGQSPKRCTSRRSIHTENDVGQIVRISLRNAATSLPRHAIENLLELHWNTVRPYVMPRIP